MSLPIILIVLAVLIVLFVIFTYNGLVKTRNRIDNAQSQIDVQLKRRADYRSSPATPELKKDSQ